MTPAPHAVALASCMLECLRRRERHDTFGVVVTRVVHARAHRVHREQVVGRRAERHIVTGEPVLARFVRENHRHAVMQRLHGLVRFGREDGEGFDDVACATL